MSTKKKRGARSASRYAPEFQRDAVTMVLDEKRPIPDVARAPEATTGTCPTDGPPDLGEVAFTQMSERRGSVTIESKLSIRSVFVIIGRSMSRSDNEPTSRPSSRRRCHDDRSTAVVSRARSATVRSSWRRASGQSMRDTYSGSNRSTAATWP